MIDVTDLYDGCCTPERCTEYDSPNVRHRPAIPPRGMTLFPGVAIAAVKFGVSRTTLYRVLKGQLPDHHRLCERYSAFVKGAAK